MIVGINYTNDGRRYISNIAYDSKWSDETKMNKAKELSEIQDEVYIVGIDKNCIPFIEEIVFRGCRIGV